MRLPRALSVLAGAAFAAGAVRAADPIKGEALFQERCTLCHQLDQPGQGPPLGGVVGRKAAGVEGFPYTDALKGSGLVWSPDSLDAFLTSPKALVPGTAMIQMIPDPGERADVIAYLAAHK